MLSVINKILPLSLLTNLNGEDDNQIKQAFDETLTPPLGEGARVIILKNNPIFTNKNDEIKTKI